MNTKILAGLCGVSLAASAICLFLQNKTRQELEVAHSQLEDAVGYHSSRDMALLDYLQLQAIDRPEGRWHNWTIRPLPRMVCRPEPPPPVDGLRNNDFSSMERDRK